MTNNELILLDQALSEAKAARKDNIADDVLFEIFSAEQILKDYDLSPEEIDAGRVGGGLDGGIDAIYVFLGEVPLSEDADLFSEDSTPVSFQRDQLLTLWIIQAKRSTSFTETAIDLLSSSLNRLLDLQESEDSLGELYSSELVDRIHLFTRAWQKLASRRPRLRINIAYSTRGSTSSINVRVKRKAADLKNMLERLAPSSHASVEFFGSSELWASYNRVPSYTLELTYQENATSGSSYAAIVRLRDYWKFICDEDGNLRRHIFDWNVRDYQGDIEVNREIRRSLEDANSPEFWWMNNGVTVICSSARIVSKTFVLDDVQIVNGLQSSHTIYEVLRGSQTSDQVGDKLLLVRILVTEDASTRDAVIRATNRQTAVPVASLRATDEIQRRIESYFLSCNWYYDRRKNYYRNIGKPADRIVSIPFLAQAVMAGGLSSPNDSRARPSSLLKSATDYERVFSGDVPLPVYLWLAKTQRKIDTVLAGLGQELKTDLRFYVTMLTTANLLGGRVYDPKQLTPLAEADEEVTEPVILAALRTAVNHMRDFAKAKKWRPDRAAKSRELVTYMLDKEFPLRKKRGS